MLWSGRNCLWHACLLLAFFGVGGAIAVTSPKPEAFPCWGYHGDEGPGHWGLMHSDWKACSEGLEQSPIILPDRDTKLATDSFEFHYRATTGELSDNSHALQVDMRSGSHLVLGGQDFFLKQFHFHTPSEHLWSDAPEAGELHLVHVSDAGGIVVVGVALSFGAEQVFPKSVWDWLQAAGPGETRVLDMGDLVPRKGSFLGYQGSLTTPPCTEGVHWILATEPMAMGWVQRQWLEKRTGQNARPVQSLGNRVVHAIRRKGT